MSYYFYRVYFIIPMIYAHIAGLTSEEKSYIIKVFNDTMYTFIDLEDYTEQIFEDNTMQILAQRYEYYCKKSRESNDKITVKQLVNKYKEIEKKMNLLWKNKMTFYISELNSDDKIILLGYCNFYKNIRTFVNIQCDVKLFIDNDNNEYVKTLIRHNLKWFSDDIINGVFSLDLLNHGFLLKKRNITKTLYEKNGYELKSLDGIETFIQNSSITCEMPEYVFFSSTVDFGKKITTSKHKKNIFFADAWICMVSYFNIKDIVSGYKMNSKDDSEYGFIQEPVPNSFDVLSNSLNLYVCKSNESFIPVAEGEFVNKFQCNRTVDVYKKISIHNVLKKLKELSIQIVHHENSGYDSDTSQT
jgi:hypothetical protein